MLGMLGVALLWSGCSTSDSITRVRMYGPEVMTYDGPRQNFDWACRSALEEVGVIDDNGVHLYYGEGGSSGMEDGVVRWAKSYMKNRDEKGYEYHITQIRMGENAPVVLLETTNPDSHVLFNVLNRQFSQWNIEVVQP